MITNIKLQLFLILSQGIFIPYLFFHNLGCYIVIGSNMTLHCTRYTYDSPFPWTYVWYFFSVTLLEHILEGTFLSPHKIPPMFGILYEYETYPLRYTMVFSCPWKSTPLPINICRVLSLHLCFSLSGGWMFRYSPWLPLREHTPFCQQLYHPILPLKGNFMYPIWTVCCQTIVNILSKFGSHFCVDYKWTKT